MSTPIPREFRLGTVVSSEDEQGDTRLGHVTGFARSDTGEVVLEVKWDTGEISTIHPASSLLRFEPIAWPEPWSQQRCLTRLHEMEEARTEASKPTKGWSRLVLGSGPKAF